MRLFWMLVREWFLCGRLKRAAAMSAEAQTEIMHVGFRLGRLREEIRDFQCRCLKRQKRNGIVRPVVYPAAGFSRN